MEICLKKTTFKKAVHYCYYCIFECLKDLGGIIGMKVVNVVGGLRFISHCTAKILEEREDNAIRVYD